VGLIADLGRGPVGVDTAVFIYFIEENLRFLPRAGLRILADRYEELLTRGRGIRLVDLTRDQLRAAAQLRAATGAKTPDALQLAAALGAGCTAFLTSDRRLPSIPGLRIIQLQSYAA
jgi:predicted nucleic acid-binding protein